MADKKMVTAVIDSVEERLADNERGWGKYRLFMEGMSGVQKVDVPSDVNQEFDLQEGFTVTLVEGPYNGWIVHSKSECFTGEVFEHAEASPSNGGGSSAPRRAPAPRKGHVASGGTGRVERSAPAAPKVATPKSGNTHTAWNDYQINVRDPHMRMQAMLKITADVHCKCIEFNCDSAAAMDALIQDAERLDEAVTKYLKL